MKQTDRVPHKARGAAESAGVPVQSAGVPAESAGTTKTSYPLMKYLSLLLAVALLFSGVTFARYLSNDQIDASVGIAAFELPSASPPSMRRIPSTASILRRSAMKITGSKRVLRAISRRARVPRSPSASP